MKKLVVVFLTGLVVIGGVIKFGEYRAEQERIAELKYNPTGTMINRQLYRYVAEFRSILQAEGIRLPWGKTVIVSFDYDLPERVLGIAFGMNIEEATFIHINGNSWKKLTEQDRRMTIFHELCHDVYDIEHGEITIMNTPKPFYISKKMVDDGMKELVEYLKKTEHYEQK